LKKEDLKKRQTYFRFTKLLIFTILIGQFVSSASLFFEWNNNSELQAYTLCMNTEMGQSASDTEMDNEDQFSTDINFEKSFLPFSTKKPIAVLDCIFYFPREIHTPPPQKYLFS